RYALGAGPAAAAACRRSAGSAGPHPQQQRSPCAAKRRECGRGAERCGGGSAAGRAGAAAQVDGGGRPEQQGAGGAHPDKGPDAEGGRGLRRAGGRVPRLGGGGPVRRGQAAAQRGQPLRRRRAPLRRRRGPHDQPPLQLLQGGAGRGRRRAGRGPEPARPEPVLPRLLPRPHGAALAAPRARLPPLAPGRDRGQL
ncbi:unnamed protein product, partial [Prorocentrum cordatum]